MKTFRKRIERIQNIQERLSELEDKLKLYEIELELTDELCYKLESRINTINCIKDTYNFKVEITIVSIIFGFFVYVIMSY
mgnify:CR=1 FL=1